MNWYRFLKNKERTQEWIAMISKERETFIQANLYMYVQTILEMVKLLQGTETLHCF